MTVATEVVDVHPQGHDRVVSVEIALTLTNTTTPGLAYQDTNNSLKIMMNASRNSRIKTIKNGRNKKRKVRNVWTTGKQRTKRKELELVEMDHCGVAKIGMVIK